AHPMAVFDTDRVLTTVRDRRITCMPGPPTLFHALIHHPSLDPEALKSLTKVTTGAAVIPTELVISMWEVLGIDTVITAYGLSESCGLVTMCRRGDDASTIAHTSGRAIPDVEVAIMDADGRLLAAGETGEIVVRGFNVMQGYLDQAEATQQTIDSDGWLHTGDIGALDEDGNLSITDRLKDMYISGGFNCYPAEIEQLLARHPAISQAAVVGMPDERMGEVGAAFLVPSSASPPDEDTLKAWCRSEMANYKIPRLIRWIDSLPLNAAGKVLKTTLRETL
ncbi:MAG: AMP-binding protein, partial [Luminiphilus sp.]